MKDLVSSAVTLILGLFVVSGINYYRAVTATVVVGGAFAQETPDVDPKGGNRDLPKVREDARKIVQEAYEKAKDYCRSYPASSQTVFVKVDDDQVAITVRCEVVNAWHAGRIDAQ